MPYKPLLISFALLTSLMLSCQDKEIISGSIAIIDGQIIDGTGEEPYNADIVIRGDQIIWIGNREQIVLDVDTILDANGLTVTPGFIDIHAHGDPLSTPDFSNFLAMGVTSIALGMDGSSQTSSGMPDWISKVGKMPLGVNVLPFIGHGTLRNESGIGLSTNPTEKQLDAMITLLDNALVEGCWGLSMGLEYFPGFYATKKELHLLATKVGEYNKLITSHIRNEDDSDIENSLVEMIELADECRVNISHIKVVYGKGTERGRDILSLLSDNNRPHTVTADLYPYTASYTGIGIVFPEWAKVPKKYAGIKSARGDELAAFLKNKVEQRNGPEATLFGNGPYKGKTLADVAEEYNLPFEIVLRDIIGPYGSSAAFFVMDEALQMTLATGSHVAIGSDGSPTMYHPRGYGSFAKVIQEWVVRDSLITLSEAIFKMSGLPSKIIGLDDRGTLQIDQKADLCIFNPKNVRALADFDTPHRLSQGMDIVIVNGKIAAVSGQLKTPAGNVLLSKIVE